MENRGARDGYGGFITEGRKEETLDEWGGEREIPAVCHKFIFDAAILRRGTDTFDKGTDCTARTCVQDAQVRYAECTDSCQLVAQRA